MRAVTGAAGRAATIGAGLEASTGSRRRDTPMTVNARRTSPSDSPPVFTVARATYGPGGQHAHVRHGLRDHRGVARAARQRRRHADERGTVRRRGDLEDDIRAGSLAAGPFEPDLQREAFVLLHAVEREARLSVGAVGTRTSTGPVALSAPSVTGADLDAMIDRADAPGAVHHGQADDVAAGRERHVRRERQRAPDRLAERLLAGQDFPSLQVAHDQLERRLARLEARGLAGDHQLETRGVVRVGGEVAGHAQPDAGRRDGRIERRAETRRPVAILVGAHVEDLARAHGHAAARDLHLHAARLAVDVARILLDADPVVAGQLAPEAIERALPRSTSARNVPPPVMPASVSSGPE